MSSYRFISGHAFDPESGDVRRDEAIVRLEPQPAALLALLADRAGRVVTHDEIRHHVWGDATHVSFRESAHYGVRQIRATFGDDARLPWLIDTIPRRGYRLRADAIVSIEAQTRPSPSHRVPAERSSTVLSGPSRAWRRPAALVGLAAALVLIAVAERRPNTHHQLAMTVVRAVHDLLY